MLHDIAYDPGEGGDGMLLLNCTTSGATQFRKSDNVRVMAGIPINGVVLPEHPFTRIWFIVWSFGGGVNHI